MQKNKRGGGGEGEEEEKEKKEQDLVFLLFELVHNLKHILPPGS